MKRGFYLSVLCFLLILMIPSAFSLSAIGSEKNLTFSTMIQASTNTIRCVDFERTEDQIQCRLASPHLLTTPSLFCSNTRESAWCEQLIRDAQLCFEFNGTAKDACFQSYANKYTVLEYDETDSYIFFLLLDLIQSAQDAYEHGTLTIRESAQLIEKLTNLAQARMRHEPQSVLTALFEDYIVHWDMYTKVEEQTTF